jgi:hypothetical protein
MKCNGCALGFLRLVAAVLYYLFLIVLAHSPMNLVFQSETRRLSSDPQNAYSKDANGINKWQAGAYFEIESRVKTKIVDSPAVQFVCESSLVENLAIPGPTRPAFGIISRVGHSPLS